MSWLASMLFREKDSWISVAPWFKRLFFSKLWVMRIRWVSWDFAPVPVATMTNNASTTINSSTNRNNISLRDTGTGRETNSWLFTKTSDGIIVNEDWYYDVYTSLYQEWTSNRTNVAVLIHKAGMLPVNEIQWASWYIRHSNGQDESSSDISNVLKLNAWDKITVSYMRKAAAWTVTAPAGTAILSVKKIW